MTAKNQSCQCAYCDGKTCYPSIDMNDPLPPLKNAPSSCPMRKQPEIIREGTTHYQKSNIKEFARQASIQEAQCYELDEGSLKTKLPRIEETLQFAAKCNYNRLGLAFCIGLRDEARLLCKIFEAQKFHVVSVCCKVGRTPKESIGLAGHEKIMGPDAMEPMCNPIVQAQILNREDVDLAIMLGLCVGHDTLFLKYCQVPTTVLAVKDRVTGHNPLAALYLSNSLYYGRLKKPAKTKKRGKEWTKVDITVDE